MSAKCIGQVWERYPDGGDGFTLALALADSADDGGYVYIEATLHLLHRARLTEPRFLRALVRLQSNGWLEVIEAQECLYRLRPPGDVLH